MPRRNDLHRILIIGSGPIIIGQACEFDYSGTQAAKALRADGYEVLLVNSNPATIMTDPELADRTYVEPLSRRPIWKRSSGASVPTRYYPRLAGKPAEPASVELAGIGVLEKYGVELIGANINAIKMAEDRLLFKDAMRRIGLETPQSQLVNSISRTVRISPSRSASPASSGPASRSAEAAAALPIIAKTWWRFWSAAWRFRRSTKYSSRRTRWAGRNSSWR